jgi:hypothetical protein
MEDQIGQDAVTFVVNVSDLRLILTSLKFLLSAEDDAAEIERIKRLLDRFESMSALDNGIARARDVDKYATRLPPLRWDRRPTLRIVDACRSCTWRRGSAHHVRTTDHPPVPPRGRAARAASSSIPARRVSQLTFRGPRTRTPQGGRLDPCC